MVMVLGNNRVGIRSAWLDHLSWLDGQLSSVRTLKVSDAGWELVEWDHGTESFPKISHNANYVTAMLH
jgi:hypothetical protein